MDRYDPDGVEWGFVNIHAINMEYLRHSIVPMWLNFQFWNAKHAKNTNER
jgi:hypothetical protein